VSDDDYSGLDEADSPGRSRIVGLLALIILLSFVAVVLLIAALLAR
jgi:hypothetical protein